MSAASPSVAQQGHNFMTVLMSQPQRGSKSAKGPIVPRAPPKRASSKAPATMKLSQLVRYNALDPSAAWNEEFYWLWFASHVTKANVPSRCVGTSKVYEESTWPQIRTLEKQFRTAVWPGLRGKRPSWIV